MMTAVLVVMAATFEEKSFSFCCMLLVSAEHDIYI